MKTRTKQALTEAIVFFIIYFPLQLISDGYSREKLVESAVAAVVFATGMSIFRWLSDKKKS